MNQRPRSLRSKLLTVILLCWVIPVALLIGLTALFLGREYRHTARSILETDAAGALQQTKLLFTHAFDASKEVTYDGVILSAYQTYLATGDVADLYRTATDYLSQKYSRDESLNGVFIGFWDDRSIVPYTGSCPATVSCTSPETW